MKILYINQKKKKNTHTHIYIKSYNFILQIFIWNRYMIGSLSMLQYTSLQKSS